MAFHAQSYRHPAILTACLIAVLAAPARADIISATATLPLLDIPYEPAVGAGCFAVAGLCVEGGALTLTSLISSNFNAGGQDIVANARYTATLTTLGSTPIGPVLLTGTVEQEVLGRTFSTQTGSWTTEIVAMSLSGPVLGATLSLSQDTANASTGTSSILPAGGEGFVINSFFDVFADLSLDGPTPLHTGVGPIALAAAPAPEPAGLAILALPAVFLVWFARGGRRAVAAGLG
jgi:hypothetical protein